MVGEQLFVRTSDIELVVLEVEANLLRLNGESFCNEFDNELSDVGFSFGMRCLYLCKWSGRNAEFDDEKIL